VLFLSNPWPRRARIVCPFLALSYSSVSLWSGPLSPKTDGPISGEKGHLVKASAAFGRHAFGCSWCDALSEALCTWFRHAREGEPDRSSVVRTGFPHTQG
jgi:hypothetical protein